MRSGVAGPGPHFHFIKPPQMQTCQLASQPLDFGNSPQSCAELGDASARSRKFGLWRIGWNSCESWHQSIFQAEEFLFEESSGKIGHTDRTGSSHSESQQNQFKVAIGAGELWKIVPANPVIHAESKQVVEIQAVTDVAEKAKDPDVHVSFLLAAAHPQEKQDHAREEEIQQRPLKCRSQHAIAVNDPERPTGERQE